MKAGLERIIASTVLTFFLCSLFFSLYLLASGMTMNGSMSDCPLMAHEEVICPINLADHIEAWKSAFLAVMPPTTLLLTAVSAVMLLVSVAPHLFVPRHRRLTIPQWQLRKLTYAFSYRPLQELFSSGILHPKLF